MCNVCKINICVKKYYNMAKNMNRILVHIIIIENNGI